MTGLRTDSGINGLGLLQSIGTGWHALGEKGFVGPAWRATEHALTQGGDWDGLFLKGQLALALGFLCSSLFLARP